MMSGWQVVNKANTGCGSTRPQQTNTLLITSNFEEHYCVCISDLFNISFNNSDYMTLNDMIIRK